jgi:hypothetical protein
MAAAWPATSLRRRLTGGDAEVGGAAAGGSPFCEESFLRFRTPPRRRRLRPAAADSCGGSIGAGDGCASREGCRSSGFHGFGGAEFFFEGISAGLMLLMILGWITFGPNAVPWVGRLNLPLLIFAKKTFNQFEYSHFFPLLESVRALHGLKITMIV